MTPTVPAEVAAATGAPAGEFHIPSLDGLRAVSFLLVFLAHVGLSQLIPGGFGVTVFFFLSGYLITSLLRLERARTGSVRLRDFYLRRVFRILPPFYAVLVLAYIVTFLGLVDGHLKLSAAISLFCHFANYHFIHDPEGFPPGTVVYWSLAVEEHFYLLFPLLHIGLSRRYAQREGMQALWLAALCALVLAWRFVLLTQLGATSNRLFMASDTRVDSILYGSILASFGNPMFDRWRGSQALWCHVLLPCGLASLLLTFVFRAEWFREAARYSVQGVALIPLFVSAIRYPRWGVFRVLNWRALRHIGTLSYSLYLCHQVVLFAVAKALPGAGRVLLAALTFAVSLAIAELVHRWIERPCARARRRWVDTAWLKPVGAAANTARGRELLATSRIDREIG